MSKQICPFCLQGKQGYFKAALRNMIAHRTDLLRSLPIFFVFITLEWPKKVIRLQFCFLDVSERFISCIWRTVNRLSTTPLKFKHSLKSLYWNAKLEHIWGVDCKDEMNAYINIDVNILSSGKFSVWYNVDAFDFHVTVHRDKFL